MSIIINGMYHTNYNGWSVECSELTDQQIEQVTNCLIDYSNDLCDDDGVFEYREFLSHHLKDIDDKIVKLVGDEFELKIEYDYFSS